MNRPEQKIKLTFISGLKDFVLKEIDTHSSLHVVHDDERAVYLNFVDNLRLVTSLRSVHRAFVVVQDQKYTPRYLANHKSLIGTLITLVTEKNDDAFYTFKINCSGSASPEVRKLASYIQDTFRLTEAQEADLKIHIIKTGDLWEYGVEITKRPLSSRAYKVSHIEGAMNPTIAYAINTLCQLGQAQSYLNVFSGSATLLIEAALEYPNLQKLIGFDYDKENIIRAIDNIKKAGLMKRIQIKGRNIFDEPDLGKFDAITADLPFGMLVSKNHNLMELYRCYIAYCEIALNPGGKMIAYTHEHKLLESIINESGFKIEKTYSIKLPAAMRAFLFPKIIVCRFKNEHE